MGWGCYKHEMDAGSDEWQKKVDQLSVAKLKEDPRTWGRDGEVCPSCWEEQEAKLKAALLQKDELRKVLSALVHSIEDTWHHIPPCDVGTERQHADTECVCGPDVEDALQVLFKTGKGAEKRVGD